MGIKKLNQYIKENCSTNSVKKVLLKDLTGKTIVVDTSIYLYKFSSDNTLIENMYNMLAIFRYYTIRPIFIFDGKPPDEKKELLLKRREDKNDAEMEYSYLKEKLETDPELDNLEKAEIEQNMNSLKKKFIRIHYESINKVKELILAYGCMYYDAIGEADELCALMVLKEKAWACLSEDMDLFVYGCNCVLRGLSLLNHTVFLYKTDKILKELSMTQKEFSEICILSGTDYNIYNKKNFYNVVDWFQEFKKQKDIDNFYLWLQKKELLDDFEKLQKIYDMFDLLKNDDNKNIAIVESIRIITHPIDKQLLKPILQKEGFLFPGK